MQMEHPPVSMPLARRIARQIRAEMGRQELTQTMLAERLGWQQQRLGRRLTAAVAVDATELEQIAAALGVPVSALIPTDDTPAEVTA